MLASTFLDLCNDNGIRFFAGVPDSYLKGLCDELFSRFGTDSPFHIVAHNEGGAIGLCAGHYIATGQPALCYMQNSGLGNAVNPLASLMDSEVYSIPCLLVIGWRGEPGVKDEPQHIKQGKITLAQLDLLDIPYRILSADTPEDAFRNDFSDLINFLRAQKTAALVVRKGAFSSSSQPVYQNRFSLSRERAAELVLKKTGSEDLIVSTTGKLSREIFEIREREKQPHNRDFLTVGSMGHASMIALSLAESLPGRRIWCLDGDGAAMMHLGAISLIGQRSPQSFIHVVINNGAHETVGGMPVCSGSLNLTATARAAGYSSVFSVDSESSLVSVLDQVLSFRPCGPVFVEICCACGARADLGRPTSTPVDNRNAMMEFIKKSSHF